MKLELLRRGETSPPSDAFIHDLARETGAALKLSPDRLVSLLLTTDDEISVLNARYREVSGPTDVLSFSQLEGEGPETSILGDIVISIERCALQARARDVSLEGEFAWLFVHGVLHLLGYDHAEAEDAAFMQKRAEEVWAELRRNLSLLATCPPGPSVHHEGEHD